jgi:hypothetical protein
VLGNYIGRCSRPELGSNKFKMEHQNIDKAIKENFKILSRGLIQTSYKDAYQAHKKIVVQRKIP